MQDLASANVTNLAGKEITFASLCLRANSAISLFQHTAALIPTCLLAAMLIPFPDPHIKIPYFTSPRSTALATRWAKSG